MPRTAIRAVSPRKISERRFVASAVPALLLGCALLFSAISTWAGDEKPGVNGPPGSLLWWSRAGAPARAAYLGGLLDMLQLERSWQGDKPLSLKRSLADAWSGALEGVRQEDIHDAVSLYASTYPEQGGLPVLYALWEIYVLPKAVSEKRQTGGKADK